ncbi:MAG: shikimate kinase [Hyphomicrobiales bacterium]
MRFGLRARQRDRKKDKATRIGSRLGDKSVVLIGLMGAGKTAVGRRLASQLSLPFVDADSEIERAAGMTVSEIFNGHGEAYFREGERKVIARLLENGPQVLATGGGAYMNEDTRRNVAARGVSVWLRADLPVLLERVARRDNRPLLKRGDPAEIMKKLMDERYPIYEQSDITVRSRDVPHDVIVDEIVNALDRQLRKHAGGSGQEAAGTEGGAP